MKKIISLILICVLLINSDYPSLAEISSANELLETNMTTNTLKDMVPSDHWSFEALDHAVGAGFMQGDSGKIRPFDQMSRAEVATAIINAMGFSQLSKLELALYQADISMFTDIDASDWFYNPLAIAYKLNLMDGVSNTNMSPKSDVTREQVFTILSRFLSLDYTNIDTSSLNTYEDVKDISPWAMNYMAAMVKAGYISGNNGYLNPGNPIKREEFAQLMFNIFQGNYVTNQESANKLVNKTINGNLIVSAEDITLEHLNVTGDVIISDVVGNGNVTLDHVTILGRLIVRGGGEHSIYLKSSTAKNIIINKRSDGGVRIHGDDGSEVSYIEIPDGKDTVIIDCSVKNIVVLVNDINIVVNEAIENISLFGDNVRMTGNGSINNLVLEKGVKKVSVETKNTNVVNASGNDISLVSQEGKTTTIASNKSTLINESTTESSVTKYNVKLHTNGGSSLNTMTLSRGSSLGSLPTPQKENSIFIGWYTDNNTFENAVAANTYVRSDMDLYASYIESEQMSESLIQTMTSVMDVNTDYIVTLISSDTTMTAEQVKAAITFEAITEDTPTGVGETPEFAGISVIGSGGTYTVAALEGYTVGSTYTIDLDNGALSFKDENSSIRTLNISVLMPDPILNLQLNDTILFIPEVDLGAVTQNGQVVEDIFVPLYTVDGDDSGGVNEDLYGSFEYLGLQEQLDQLIVGNQVAIYKGIAPELRTAEVDYTDDLISYFNITAINGRTISYGSSDPSEIVFTPDVLPVNEVDDVDGDPNNDSITILISNMTYTDAEFADMELSSATVDTGDFIAFYTDDQAEDDPLVYARITSVEIVSTYYVILYEDVSETAVYGSMDMASSSDLSYEQIESSIGVEEMEETIQQQYVESGFAEAATEYLVALSELDDDTRDQITRELGIENFNIVRSTSPAPSMSDSGPETTVKVKLSKYLQHFSGKGLRAEVLVTTVIALGDNMSLTLSGTFVEEIKVKMNIKSKTIWKKKRKIFPYIYDYKITSTIDVYNYTYLAVDMKLKSESNEGWSDEFNVTDSIEKLKDMTSPIEANDTVREFYELYQDMMEEEHAYFKLFSANMGNFSGSIDPFHILAYGFSVDFVVALDANVALGTEFSYEKATRYSFSLRLKTKTTTNKQTDLIDEKYSFNVYAMGELGIRAGIKLTLKVGLIDVRLNSIGISAEVGAYWKIWGFVNYSLKYEDKKTTTKASGASYMEIGIYLTTKFNAQVGNGKIEYNKVLYSNTWPLWHAGSKYYYYDFKYVLNSSTDDIVLKGNESEYTLPSSVFKMLRMDFKTGDVTTKTREADDFKYTIKDDPNHVFSVSDTGVVTVTPPDNSDIAKATLQVTWNKTPLSFTSVPISRTYELIWDNLADSYIIRFNSNEGDNVSSIKGGYLSNITLPTPVRQGYIFDGWYTDNQTFTHEFTETKMPSANNQLYAKWTADNADYTVRHYLEVLEGSGYVLADSYTYTDTTDNYVTPSVKSYTGYQAPNTQTEIVTGDKGTVIEYYYTRNDYIVTFVLGDGLENMVSTQKYGSEIVVPIPYKLGYVFTGWNTDVAETMPAANITYTAQWSLDTYTITYDLDGGSVGSNPADFTINSGDLTLENPTKDGYIFTGWKGTGLYSELKSLTIKSGSQGNRYYTASWKADSDTVYTVYHKREDLAGNYTILEVEAFKGVAGEATTAVAKSYVGFTTQTISQEAIEGDETTIIEIMYERNTYNLTFDANGGVADSTTGVKYEATITVPTVTKAGFDFVGWDSGLVTTMPADDLTYIAQWQASVVVGNNVFGVKYNAQYQVFDIRYLQINGRAFDSSWGSGGSSSGHQFSDSMLENRYFVLKETGDTTEKVALYMYENDGTPVEKGISANLSEASLIGSLTNANLASNSSSDTLLAEYGADWAKGLVAVGNVITLWDEGLYFESANGFGYIISGKAAYLNNATLSLSNPISNPTIDQLKAITDFEVGPLTVE